MNGNGIEKQIVIIRLTEDKEELKKYIKLYNLL